MRKLSATARLLRTSALLAATLTVMPAQAQLVDLDTSPAACMPGATNSASFENASAINEQILALTNPVGANVFWELSYSAATSTLPCTQTPATGFATGFTCTNGLEIALPAGAAETTSVVSTQPVAVSAPAMSGVGTATFSLTATRDDDALPACQVASPDPALGCGTFPSCQNFYEIEILEPKQAFDLVFVLDRSGSMTLPASGGTRWDALRTGVEIFLPFVENVAKAPTPAGSRFGVTFFATGVDPSSTPMFDILQPGSNTPSADFGNVPSLLEKTPSGFTAMGLGLQDAIAKTPDAGRPRAIALFTDGEQNRNPRVALDGCGFTNPASPLNPPDCPATSGHRICSVGIGGPSSDFHTTLANLGTNNRGTMLSTDNGSDFTGGGVVPGDIGSAFQGCIGNLLQDNSPQQIAYYTGSIETDPVVLPDFDVTRRADRVLLSLTLSQRFEAPQLAQMAASGIIVTRDGTDVTEEFEPIVYGGPTDVVTLVADYTGDAAPEPGGTYSVTLNTDGQFEPRLEYRLVPYADDRRFSAASRLSPAVAPVNGSIDVAVQLAWLNLGIEDATVVVRAFGPDTDMGEALSQPDPVEVQPLEDETNAGIQKYDQLAASDPTFLESLALSPNAIAMTHQGGGLYTGSYAVPDNVGVVHFVYDVQAEGTAYGGAQRRWYESAYARPDAIDTAGSSLLSSLIDGALVLTITPVRPSGKLLGPGHLSAFAFDGVTVQRADDRQDGSYAFTLADGASPEDPITVSLLGEGFYSGPAAWGERRGMDRTLVDILRSPLLWIVILLLILLIVLLWFLLRRRPATP